MPCMRHAAVLCIFLTDMTSLTFSFIFHFIFELLNIFMEFSKSNWSMLLTFPLLEFSFTIWIIPDPSIVNYSRSRSLDVTWTNDIVWNVEQLVGIQNYLPTKLSTWTKINFSFGQSLSIKSKCEDYTWSFDNIKNFARASFCKWKEKVIQFNEI